MDDNPNSQLFAFDSPLNQSSYIKVIGVGGGGNNAVNHMFQKGIEGVDFIVTNTDMKALNSSPVSNKLVLGHEGLGVGGRPAKARRAAEEKETEIKELFSHNTKMVFITAGMGGGTGTGAAPVIAKFAKDIQLETEDEDDPGKILVVAVVTTPFYFEGRSRLQQADAGVEELRKYVDSILVINNEKLRSFGNLPLSDAFAMANDVLLTAVKGIAEIITLNAYVNIDFRDVNTVMENSGTALLGIGEGEGDNRAQQAVEEATTSVLLNDNDIAGAKNVLLYFSYGSQRDITMDEVGVVTEYINQKTGSYDTEIIWGYGSDDSLGEKLKITLIATGFEAKEASKPGKNISGAGSPDDGTPAQKPQETEQPGLTQHQSGRGIESQGMQDPTASSGVLVDPFPGQTPTSNPTSVQQSGTTRPEHRVYQLDGDVVEKRPEPQKTTDEDMYGPRLISSSDATTTNQPEQNTPQPQPVQTRPPVYQKPPVRVPNPLDVEVMNSSDRIKIMYEMLHNDVNGPEKLESIKPSDLTGERISEMSRASRPETSASYLDANGNVLRNAAVYEQAD